MRSLVQLALQGYKRWISPVFPVSCRYVPTCSEYAEEAVERFGVIRGTMIAVWRILRCNPFGGSGYDPVVKVKGSPHVCHHFHTEEIERASGATEAPRFAG